MNVIDPKNKVIFHFDRIGAIKNGCMVPPISVEIDLSDNCNLGCSWCRFAQGHKPSMMPFELARKILMELKEFGVRSIVYSGGGEPTMNPDFAKILYMGYELDLDQGVYTNGTNLSEENTDALDYCTKFTYVSIDAASKKTYLSIKRRDLFKVVLKSVQIFCKRKKKTRVGLGFLISPQNMDEIEEFEYVKYFTGADYIQYRPAVGTLTLEQTIDARQRARRMATEHPSFIFSADYKFEDLTKQFRDNDRGYKKCHGHNLLGGISADGTVWYCLNRRYQEGWDIGDLNTDSFKDIWEKKFFSDREVDVMSCPLLCRPHELNKFLDVVMEAENDHKNFL